MHDNDVRAILDWSIASITVLHEEVTTIPGNFQKTA